MFWCCERAGIKWSTAKYVILGDDVLIGDGVLAGVYLATLESLGVEASSAKSFTSEEFCEFAKRYLYKGEEVTPFPVSSVLENRGDHSLLISALYGETRKGL